jgi:serine/threonine-protein kinase RsbW
MRSYITDVLKKHEVSEIETNMMVLAVDEVCANIIIHGHEQQPEYKVSLTVEINQEQVVFEIIDFGHAFDIVSYKTPELDELIKNQNKGGIGIMLVKKIMDKIEFIPGQDKNVLILSKKRSNNS